MNVQSWAALFDCEIAVDASKRIYYALGWLKVFN